MWFDTVGLLSFGLYESQVSKNNPQPIPELNTEIIRVITEIEHTFCRNVIENFNERVYEAGEGVHLADIIFRL